MACCAGQLVTFLIYVITFIKKSRNNVKVIWMCLLWLQQQYLRVRFAPKICHQPFSLHKGLQHLQSNTLAWKGPSPSAFCLHFFPFCVLPFVCHVSLQGRSVSAVCRACKSSLSPERLHFLSFSKRKHRDILVHKQKWYLAC